MADNLTKSKTPNINLGSSPSRPHSNAVAGSEFQGAPGQYDHGVKFANDVNGFTIGEKREKPIGRTVGPGEYDVDRANNATRHRSPEVQFGESPSRNTFDLAAQRRALDQQISQTLTPSDRKPAKKGKKKPTNQPVVRHSATGKTSTSGAG